MRKNSLAILATSIFATAIALPDRADAMTFSAPSGLRSAVTKVDVVQPEQVRWCSWFGCPVGYFRPWPYYAFYHRSYWRWRLTGVVATQVPSLKDDFVSVRVCA